MKRIIYFSFLALCVAPACARPVTQSAVTRPTTSTGTVSRPVTAVPVLRPTTTAAVTRPTTSTGTINRPVTAATVVRPTTTASVSRPVTTATVTRPTTVVPVFEPAAGPTNPTGKAADKSASSGGSYSPSYKNAKTLTPTPKAAPAGRGEAGLGLNTDEAAKDKAAKESEKPKAEDSNASVDDVLKNTKLPPGLEKLLKQKADSSSKKKK